MDKNLLERIANELANIYKEMKTASSTAASSANGAKKSKYEDTKGRGGNLNKDSDKIERLVAGGGKLPAARELNKNLKELTDSINKSGFKNSIKRAAEGINEAFDNLIHPKQSHQARITNVRNQMLEEAEEFAAMQIDAQKKMLESVIKHIKEEGTDFGTIQKTAGEFEKATIKLHELSNETGDVRDGLNELDEQLKKLKEAAVGGYDALSTLSAEQLQVYNERKSNPITGDPNSEEYKKKQKDLQEVIHALNESLTDGANVLNEGTRKISDNIQGMIAEHRVNMTKASKAMLLVSGHGIMNFFEDTLFQAQANIGTGLRSTALMLGMSHRELQEGFLQYRDVIRLEAGIRKGQVLDSQSEDFMEDSANLFRSFGYAEDAAFHMGMRLREAAKNAGIGANLNLKSMKDFYKGSSIVLNQTVEEFGDFFNDLSKDSGFAAFNYALRTSSKNVQEGMQKEIFTRMKMNKLMGLTNEELQKRLNLEQESAWSSLEEKYKRQTGVKTLMKILEKEGLAKFSGEEYAAVEAHGLNPLATTDAQKDAVNGVLAILKVAPTLIQEKGAKEYQRTGDIGVLHRQQALIEQTRIFGDMTGELFGWNPKESANVAAQYANYAEETNSTMLQVADNMRLYASNSNQMDPTLRKLFDTMTGQTAAEQAIGDEKDGYKGVTGLGAALTYMDAKEKAMVIAQNTIIQTFAAVARAGYDLIGAYYMQAILLKGIGLGGGVATAGRAAAGVAAAGTKMTAGILGVTTSLGLLNAQQWDAIKGGGFQGLKAASGGLLRIAGAAYFIYESAVLGYKLGTYLYNQWKDKEWFTNAADTTFDVMHIAARVVADNLTFGMYSRRERAQKEAEFQQEVDRINARRKETLREELSKVNQAHLVDTMSVAEINKRLNLDDASKALREAIDYEYNKRKEESVKPKEPTEMEKHLEQIAKNTQEGNDLIAKDTQTNIDLAEESKAKTQNIVNTVMRGRRSGDIDMQQLKMLETAGVDSSAIAALG